MPLQTLENGSWQVGILPETGSATAFGRIWQGGRWIDVMRPTAVNDYGNVSQCSSFIMLPWANRIRDARFRFGGHDYQLQPNDPEGTARHGLVRRLPWLLESAAPTRVVTTFDSASHGSISYPFKFSARAEFSLDGHDFIMGLSLRNEDTQPFPAGFGHHPYFVRDDGNLVQVEIRCERRFELVDAMAFAPPVPLTPETDFRAPRPLGTAVYEELLTWRSEALAARLVYPDLTIAMHADDLFKHVLLFAPEGKPFFAVEPQTNANDGFNLDAKGIEGSGVFVLQPGESRSGTVSLRIEA